MKRRRGNNKGKCLEIMRYNIDEFSEINFDTVSEEELHIVCDPSGEDMFAVVPDTSREKASDEELNSLMALSATFGAMEQFGARREFDNLPRLFYMTDKAYGLPDGATKQALDSVTRNGYRLTFYIPKSDEPEKEGIIITAGMAI